jgi:RNA polymerase sporulation-specific sigma factor
MYFRSKKKTQNEVSINETIDVDRDGNPLTYIDVISSDENVTEDIDRKLQCQKAVYLVQKVLTPREKQIIIMRYGLGGAKPLTQRETSEKLGISRSYVSRIEKGALVKLKDGFELRK